jgi:hypothetical protein
VSARSMNVSFGIHVRFDLSPMRPEPQREWKTVGARSTHTSVRVICQYYEKCKTLSRCALRFAKIALNMFEY